MQATIKVLMISAMMTLVTTMKRREPLIFQYNSQANKIQISYKEAEIRI